MSRLYISTDLLVILSFFVATGVNVLFTKSIKKNCNLNVQNREGEVNDFLNNVKKDPILVQALGTGQASLRRSSEDGGCGDIWGLRLYESSDHPLSPEYRKLPRRKYTQNSKPEGSAKCFSDFVCCKMHLIKRARQSR